ncbi:MAG: 2OG-Fe(II) oxygenase [Motilibacteraceae bacterium]
MTTARWEGHAALSGWEPRGYALHDPLDDDEPPYTVADAWEPPHPLALDALLIDRLLEAAHACRPIPNGNGHYFLPDLDERTRADVVDRFAEANHAWWELEVAEWDVMVKRYRVGERHVAHQDMHAGAAGRKVAGIAQLSAPEDYEGGALVVHFAGQRLELPGTRGTLIALPGWTVHEVEPVTAGERWSLIVNGRGPRLR